MSSKIETNKFIVTSYYPDACEKVYAKLSLCIWCPMLDIRLSGFFHTFEEAWIDAVRLINNKNNHGKY